MCLVQRNNILIEIRFPKDYWDTVKANRYIYEHQIDAMRLEADIFSQYIKYIYHDIRIYHNQRTVKDVRRNILFVYGDRKRY